MNRLEDCPECVRLSALLARAQAAGDHTLATDCRVLMRRHPAHDGVPVAATESAT